MFIAAVVAAGLFDRCKLCFGSRNLCQIELSGLDELR